MSERLTLRQRERADRLLQRGGTLVQIVATYFCCGVVVDDEYRVIEAAPILRWSVGKRCGEIKKFLERKGAFISWRRV